MSRTNKTPLKTLRLRLNAQCAELAVCTTFAMRYCVEQAIQDTQRQIAELLG